MCPPRAHNCRIVSQHAPIMFHNVPISSNSSQHEYDHGEYQDEDQDEDQDEYQDEDEARDACSGWGPCGGRDEKERMGVRTSTPLRRRMRLGMV